MKKWIYICAVILYTVIGIGLFIYNGTSQEVIVPGQVVDFKWTRHYGRGPGTYSSIISFELNGNTHRFTRKPSSWFKPKIGRTYEVAVAPTHPNHARTLMPSLLERLLPSVVKQHPDILYPWLVGYIGFALWFLFGFCTAPSCEEDTSTSEKIPVYAQALGILMGLLLMGFLFWGVSLID